MKKDRHGLHKTQKKIEAVVKAPTSFIPGNCELLRTIYIKPVYVLRYCTDFLRRITSGIGRKTVTKHSRR